MAATEYYMGSAAARQFTGQSRPGAREPARDYQFTQNPSHPQLYDNPHPYSSPHTLQKHQYNSQLRTYHPHAQQGPPQGYPQPPSHPPPPVSQPYLAQAGPQSYRQQSYRHQNHLLGVPLQRHRSHSQPAARRVHFADTDSYSADSGRSYDSDDSSPRRRHRGRRHRHHSNPHPHPHHGDPDSTSDSDRSYGMSTAASRSRDKSHKDRNTFFGAGAGGVIGDALLPGLGTVGGLLLGGYGGRKRARKREVDAARRRRRDAGE